MNSVRKPAPGSRSQSGREPGGQLPSLAVVALSLTVISTIAFLPGSFDRWTLPKVTVVAIATVLAAFVTPRGRLPRWAIATLGVMGIVFVATALMGRAPVSQLLGRWPGYEGLVSLPAYAAALWIGVRLVGPVGRTVAVRLVYRAVAWASIALFAVAALESMGLRPIPSDATRPGSLTGSGTDQGILAATIAVILLPAVIRLAVARVRNAQAILILGGCAAAVLTTVLSASRIGLAALVVAAGLVGCSELVRMRAVGTISPPHAWAMIAAVPVGTVVVAGAVPFTRHRVTSLFSAESVWSDRPLIWSKAWELAAERPLSGWGASGFVDAVPRTLDAEWFGQVDAQVTLDSPHSGYLQLLLAGGAPLAVLGIALLVVAFISIGRKWRRAVGIGTAPNPVESEFMAAAFGACTVLSIGLITSFSTPSIVVLPALMLGAALAIPPSRIASRSAAIGTMARPAVLSLWALLLAIATFGGIPLNHGVAAAREGDVATADREFESAQSMRFWDADVAQIAAQSMAEAADAGNASAAPLAIRWAERALARTPDSVLTQKALAVAYMSVGDWEQAQRELDVLVDLTPQDPQVAHRLGGVLLAQGRIDAAIAELERAAAIDPANADIQETLQFAYEAAA